MKAKSWMSAVTLGVVIAYAGPLMFGMHPLLSELGPEGPLHPVLAAAVAAAMRRLLAQGQLLSFSTTTAALETPGHTLHEQ